VQNIPLRNGPETLASAGEKRLAEFGRNEDGIHRTAMLLEEVLVAFGHDVVHACS
jgi:hypothetical protein